MSSPEIKYIPLLPPGKSALGLPPSRPNRGAARDRHERGAGCDGRGSARDERGLMRTAKSCRSDAPMPASSLREEAQATVSNKPGHRGEREVSRKTIARGRPGLLRCTCGDYARVLVLFRTRDCGCIGHPAFPAPSDIRGTKVRPNLGRSAPRECGVASANNAV